MRKIMADIEDLRLQNELRRDSILNKKTSEMNENEQQALMLVMLIPTILGAIAGGKDGLFRGIAAGLSATGTLLEKREEALAATGDIDKAEITGLNILNLQLDVQQAIEAREGVRDIDPSDLQSRIKAESGGKPLNEQQSKSLIFSSRMRNSEDSLLALESSAEFDPSSFSNTTISSLIPDIAKSENLKLYEQAKLDFGLAVLRKESGAALKDEEIVSVNRLYFPTAGDGEAVIAQKQASRTTALQTIRATTGLSNELLEDIARSKRDKAPKGIEELSDSDLLKLTSSEELDRLSDVDLDRFIKLVSKKQAGN